MGKRGPKPNKKVHIEWSGDFAYAIGLIVTDGNISRVGSRVTLVSKDKEQIETFARILNLNNKISTNKSSSNTEDIYRIQFKDVRFVQFLNNIGIYSAKSKTIGNVKIEDKYFFDYLRGCFDGDGTIYATWDKRWKSSYMFYIDFVSASKKYILSLRKRIKDLAGLKGFITDSVSKSGVFRLRYAKNESLILIDRMYGDFIVSCLSRKKLKILDILAIVAMKKS